MAVLADCHDCGDLHDLGDRPASPPDEVCLTVCPLCGSCAYETVAAPDVDLEVERERIIDLVLEADGIGTAAAEGLADHFLLEERLRAAGLEDLREADGVGEQNALALTDVLW